MTETAIDRVRTYLRRYIVRHARWLPAVEDGPASDGLVQYLLTGQAPEREAVTALTDRLGEAPADGDLADVERRVEELAFSLKLSSSERDLVWLLLAPEVDPQILAIYRILWAEPQRRYCDIDFICGLLDPVVPARVLAAVDRGRPLWSLRFVVERDRGSESPLLRLSQRTVLHLLGDEALPESLDARVFACAEQPSGWDGCELWPRAMEALRRDRGRHAAVWLQGGAADDAELALRQLLAGGPLSLVSATLASPMLADRATGLRQVLREARLRHAAVLLCGADSLGDVDVRCAAALLRAEAGPVFLHSASRAEGAGVGEMFAALVPLHVEVDALTAAERLRMWQHLVGDPDPNLIALPVGPAAMTRALAIHTATGEGLEQACVSARGGALGTLGTPVRPNLDWDRVVLPEAVKEQIDEVRAFGRHYRLIMEDWGLGEIKTGRGIKALFSGPPGTGKTLVSSLLARDIGVELFRVELPSIVSKYVGETDQQLAALFDEAERTGCGLLFDEADSLFSRRTEVKSSVDRYANQTVNYLLQRVEAFDGLAILTTNLERSIDSAFVRRLHYHVRFVIPEAADRLALWEAQLPASLPRGADLDLAQVATRYELAGGQIRKVVLRAAVYAADGRGEVGAAEVTRSIEREYAELGKLMPRPR